MDIFAKINEAKVYQSMGLPEEALNIYQQILVGEKRLNPKAREKIKEQILSLRKEISAQDQGDIGQISGEEITAIKQAVDSHGGIQGILDQAEAFKELTLYGEALDEYKKLFQMDYPKKEVVAKISGCLLDRYSPSDTVHRVVNILSDRTIQNGKEPPSPKGSENRKQRRAERKKPKHLD